jgi:hypothetical protein
MATPASSQGYKAWQKGPVQQQDWRVIRWGLERSRQCHGVNLHVSMNAFPELVYNLHSPPVRNMYAVIFRKIKSACARIPTNVVREELLGNWILSMYVQLQVARA